MSPYISPVKVSETRNIKMLLSDRPARRFFLNRLKKLVHGKVVIVENNQRYTFGNSSDRFPIEATVVVHHPRLYTRLFWGGLMGAAEAYMEGLWTSNNLTAVIRIFLINRAIFKEMAKGPARLTAPLYNLYQFIRRNTKVGSRKNIHAHYDLGNDFYNLFLDETMTYSCGIFESEASTLKDASVAKYDRICRKLNLSTGDRVLEIGTGWGGFALHAAAHYQAHITTTTISDNQYRFVNTLIEKKGLQKRITLIKKDYRDLSGKFDKIVSIEMIEAVGHQYLGAFFEACSRLLENDGLMVLQAITIGDQIFDRHKRSVDFIKRYIFPGSCIPSITAMSQAIAGKTDLQIVDLEDITPHYARTLREWRRCFFADIDKVKGLGFSKPFIRMWEYYLSYCEAGFAERYIGDVQMVLAKPFWRHSASSSFSNS